MNDNKKTTAEVALEWRVTPSTVYRWLKAGLLQFEKIGRTIRITGPIQKPGTIDVSKS
jgi:excisionase family DNA binding protein